MDKYGATGGFHFSFSLTKRARDAKNRKNSKKQEELAENKARNGNRTRKDTTTVGIEMGSAKATDPEPYARLTSSLSSI